MVEWWRNSYSTNQGNGSFGGFWLPLDCPYIDEKIILPTKKKLFFLAVTLSADRDQYKKKMNKLSYEDFQMQQCLSSTQFTNEEKQLLFSLRSNCYTAKKLFTEN